MGMRFSVTKRCLAAAVALLALVLVACGSGGQPDESQQAPDVGTFVGTIEEIDGGALSIATVDGSIVAAIGPETSIQRFAAGDLNDLSVNQRVTVMGQPVENGVAAGTVIVSPAGTSLFQDRGEFDLGRGGRGLVGTIGKIEGNNATINTVVGPRVATLSAEETSVQLPTPTSIEGLARDQLVTLAGKETGNGRIAVSILINPDFSALLSAGGPPTQSGQDGAPTGTPVPPLNTQRQIGDYKGVTFVVTDGSQATFTVEERLALLPLPIDAIMRTTALSGEVHLDGRPSVVEVDLLQLSSDQRFRDRYVRNRLFADHPRAVFTVNSVSPLPDGFDDGDEVATQMLGVLDIQGIEVPFSFQVEARDDGSVIFILGRATFLWSDFGLATPTAATVVSLEDEVEVQVLLEVRPLLGSS